MRVLVVHNHYQQPGGEDNVFAAETALLESNGHDVARFTLHNDSIHWAGLGVALRSIWNRQTYRALREATREHRAEVVQTLHNYRLLCPAATFFRDGKICQSCTQTLTAWPAVLHRCYRGSRGATATTAALLTVHRLARTYRRAVDRYIALTNFSGK